MTARAESHIHVATGDWRFGGGDQTYKPQRPTFQAASEYLQGGDVSSLDQVEPGKGAVLRVGLRKDAPFRDPDGHRRLRSSVCAHAGCSVHWNDFEKCWDCPCHGSHFAPLGKA